MSEKKFTRGPWHAKRDGMYVDTPWSVSHEDDHDATWAPVTSESGRTLAIVVNDDTKRPMRFHEDEMHANARLIAAAPELLEFAEEWLRIQGSDENYMTAKAKKAIAKATGASQ